MENDEKNKIVIKKTGRVIKAVVKDLTQHKTKDEIVITAWLSV